MHFKWTSKLSAYGYRGRGVVQCRHGGSSDTGSEHFVAKTHFFLIWCVCMDKRRWSGGSAGVLRTRGRGSFLCGGPLWTGLASCWLLTLCFPANYLSDPS